MVMAKLLERLLATAAFWVRIQTYLLKKPVKHSRLVSLKDPGVVFQQQESYFNSLKV